MWAVAEAAAEVAAAEDVPVSLVLEVEDLVMQLANPWIRLVLLFLLLCLTLTSCGGSRSGSDGVVHVGSSGGGGGGGGGGGRGGDDGAIGF
ncbi:MAG: hypothetical protein AB7F75_04905 [Planctomycetota bacterium]